MHPNGSAAAGRLAGAGGGIRGSGADRHAAGVDKPHACWRVLASIPLERVAETGRPVAGDSWLFSFSRYDYTQGKAAPVLSSTSPHQVLSYHRQQEWGTLVFDEVLTSCLYESLFMKIIADRNMPYAAEAFETLGETVIRDGRALTAADVRDADVLAIRSTTQVNAALLAGSRVRFVGTATIGTDHMDIPYLESHGIGWCFSPGCNANSVSEYFTAALLHLAVSNDFTLAGKTVGVIGVGNVGRRVVDKARALGMKVLMNDPPRQRQARAAGRDAEAAEFVALEVLLAESDVVTVHVPMEKGGTDPTFHLADAAFFGRMRPGAVFINAARGAVVDTSALLEAIRGGRRLAHVVLDTWEGEPGAYHDDLLDRVDIATPHIAGHSFEGKVGGTEMVYRAVCAFAGQPVAWIAEGNMPPPPVPCIRMDAQGLADEAALNDIVRQVYDIMADDARMRTRADDAKKGDHFDHLRKNYPMRREFRFTEVACAHAAPALRTSLRALGFRLA